jgi:hypothetical protein
MAGCSFCYKTLILAHQRSGSFPEQSNKRNERRVTWRQTNKTVYIYNRKQAGKPRRCWSYEKSPVTEVTEPEIRKRSVKIVKF